MVRLSKIKVIIKMVLPAVPYGVELTHLSPSSFKSLQARCSSALWGKSNKRDHHLAPLLAAADIDEPFVLAFNQMWHTLQRMLQRYQEDVLKRWNVVLDNRSMLVGPISCFHGPLYQIG